MRPLALAALLAAIAAPASAQTIRGRVVDRAGQPLSAARVELRAGPDVRAHTTSFPDGSFVIRIPSPGTYSIAASRLGFEPMVSDAFHMERSDSLSLTLRLATSAVALDTIEAVARPRLVSARLAGFYERARRSRNGRFMTRPAIEAARAYTTSDLLRRFPGLAFRQTNKGGWAVRGRGGCEPQVYIDGMNVSMYGTSNTVDDMVRPEDLEGIEVYGSSGIPVEFERNTPQDECGAVLLWTRVSK